MKTLLTILFLAFSTIAFSQKVRIAAAANVRYAMDDILQSYKNINPNIDIEIIYGASGNIYSQISNGAPYDMFFSADVNFPERLHKEGLSINEPKVYAEGRLVLWSLTIDVSSGIEVLKEYPQIKIAIANPYHAPYGQRAVEVLKYYKMYENIQPQLIKGENISQAAQFCITGNTQVGFLALASIFSPNMINKGYYYLIDNKTHNSLRQAYIITKNAKDNTAAHDFAKFIESKEARVIFEKYGFTLE